MEKWDDLEQTRQDFGYKQASSPRSLASHASFLRNTLHHTPWLRCYVRQMAETCIN